MLIFLLTTDNPAGDFKSFVVIANSEREARTLAAKTDRAFNKKAWLGERSRSKNNARCEVLGETKPAVTNPRVVLSAKTERNNQPVSWEPIFTGGD